MKIFDKRPLSLILCIMLGAFVFFTFAESVILKIVFITLLAFVFATTFIKPLAKRVKIVFFRILILCSAISIATSIIYFDIWFNVYDRYDDYTVIVGTVTDIEPHTYRAAIDIKTDNINDEPFSSYNLKVYLDSNKYYGYSIGSKVSLIGKIEAFSSDNTSFDIKSYYISQGISGVVSDVKDFSILEVGDYTAEYKISSFREKICRKIILTSDTDTGGLLCALLLGEKDYLPAGTQLSFSRIGISHILALSGMHLAILAVGLSKFLRLLKMGKKSATAITILFTVFYMVITGLSVSVTRAGIMLIVSSSLFLLSRTRDSMTSLFIAVAIICIIEPYSVYDTSLWLSAFATLGIVVMSEYQSQKYSKPSILKWTAISLLSSLFALSATFAISVIKFDGISLAAPISTLIFSVIVELFLYIGTVLLFFGSFLPINIILEPMGRIIINLSAWISEIKWIYVSTNYLIIEILAILFTVVFFSFFIFEIKHKKIAISSIGILLCAVFAISAALTYNEENKTDAVYYCLDNTEQIILTDSDAICAIDIAQYDKTSAYDSISNITNNNLTRIDTYILTHYSYDIEKNLTTVLNSLLIEKIFIPIPQNEIEERILASLIETVSDYGVSLYQYKNSDSITSGKYTVTSLFNNALGELKKNIITVSLGDEICTYLNVDALEDKTKNMALETIATSDTIIFGRHETGNSEYKFTYKIEAETVIFSSQRIVMHSDTFNYYIKRNAIFNPDKIRVIR